MLLPEHLPEPWRRVRVSFLQPLAACAGMNATPAPPETKPAEAQPGAGGWISGGEPRAPQHHRGGGVRVWTPHQGFLRGQAHPREEHPLEEGYQKPCSSIKGSNIKGPLAGGEHLEPFTPEKSSVWHARLGGCTRHDRPAFPSLAVLPVHWPHQPGAASLALERW